MAHSGHRITDISVQNEYTTAIEALYLGKPLCAANTVSIGLQSAAKHQMCGLEIQIAVKMPDLRQDSVPNSAKVAALPLV